MAAEKLPEIATGANIRSSVNNHADGIDSINRDLTDKVNESQLDESFTADTIPLRKEGGRVEVGAGVDGADAINKTQFDSALENKADLNEDGVLKTDQIPIIPESKLPEVNIFQNIMDAFEPGQLEIGATGKIQIIGGGSPDPASTPPVGSLTGRNYKFIQTTWPNDLQLRTNGGSPVDYVSGTNIYVGNEAVAANYYESRVKAVPGSHQSSSWFGNAAIDASGGGGYIPVTFLGGEDIINGIANGNAVTFTASGRARTTSTLLTGQDGSIRATLNTYAAVIVSLDPTSLDGRGESAYGMVRQGSGKVQAFVPNGYELESPVLPENTEVFMDLVGANVVWYYGADRTQFATTARISGNLTAKAYGDGDSIVIADTEGFS